MKSKAVFRTACGIAALCLIASVIFGLRGHTSETKVVADKLSPLYTGADRSCGARCQMGC